MTKQTCRDAILFFIPLVMIQLGVIWLGHNVFGTADKLYVRENKGYCEGLTMADLLAPDREIKEQIKRECK